MVEERQADRSDEVRHRARGEARFGARGVDHPALDAQGELLAQEDVIADGRVDAAVHEFVRRRVTEIETGVPTEHVERHAVAGGDVEDEAGRADEGLGRRAHPDGIVRLQHDVRLESHDFTEEVPEARPPADLVREVERLVVLGPGAEGAELVGVCALPGERRCTQRQRRSQRDESSHRQAPLPHGSWCSSTRRFCARPAAVVLVATGFDGP